MNNAGGDFAQISSMLYIVAQNKETLCTTFATE